MSNDSFNEIKELIIKLFPGLIINSVYEYLDV